MQDMTSTPILHLMVGLAGVGKTTLAKQIEAETSAIRLTPDEWMAPLFGESEADGRRDILEGRFIWLAHRALVAGCDVILDFGCWSPEERYAIRMIAECSGADYQMHYLTLPEEERRARSEERWQCTPSETFQMSPDDHDRFLRLFTPPDESEAFRPLPPPPSGHESWSSWASHRWPTLPRLDRG